jgi:hypothetical protein
VADRLLKKKMWSLKRVLVIAGITSLAAAALKPRHDFGKNQVQVKHLMRDDSPMTFVPTLQILLSLVKFAGTS